jgi:hypothetical protein
MAFGACRSNVLAGDRRSRISVRQNGMCRVACCTVRGNDEPFLQQPLSVNTLREILEDVILMDGSLSRNRSAFPMALAA